MIHDPAQISRLRSALDGFTVDAVLETLGIEAWRALSRNETTPGLRATTDGSRLSTLIRLFPLQASVSRAAAEHVFGDLLGVLIAGEILARDGDEVRALVDLRPYGDEDHDWWICSDLTPGLNGVVEAVSPDHVLGISEASSSLAQLTARTPVRRALDLGTGCGVQALHLATHAQQVVATDVNPRALAMAQLTTALNGVDAEFSRGSLYEPVTGRFDLIVTNPPFVVSPPEGERLVYRETEFVGDAVVRHVITGAADHLTENGVCQILAAWLEPQDQAWDERLASWIEPTGLDAWVIRRESLDLAEYTELWLADAGLARGPEFGRRYDAWLTWFEDQGIGSMGFGWINLLRSGRETPSVRIEHRPEMVSQPVGTEFADWPGRLADLDAGDVLERRWRVADDVVEETVSRPGDEEPHTISVRRTTGLAPSRRLDTVAAGLVATCDGDLTAGQILAGISTLLGLDAADIRSQYRSEVVDLVADGFLVLA